MDPDKRVREAISLVFVKFRELGSMRQVLLWLRQESIELPSVTYGAEGRAVVWKLPVYATILKFLTNPIYGGRLRPWSDTDADPPTRRPPAGSAGPGAGRLKIGRC